MDRMETRAWIETVAREMLKQGGEEGAVHFEIFDDHGHGWVCAFEMEKGKVLWWSWNGNVIDVCEFPLKIKMTSTDGQSRAAWIRSREWQPA